jgi:hypothetical protein
MPGTGFYGMITSKVIKKLTDREAVLGYLIALIDIAILMTCG